MSNITNMLSEGRVTFSYQKADGSVRQATGTTKLDLIPEGPDRATAQNTAESAVIAYYDLDKSGWRSFRRENLREGTVATA